MANPAHPKRHRRRATTPPVGAVPRPLLRAGYTPGSAAAPSGAANHSGLSGGVQMPPGEPLQPTGGMIPSDGGPRQWGYPVGYNIAQRPRASEQTSFEALRNLAALYDGIQLCERVYFDLLGRLELRVVPRSELVAEGQDARSPAWRSACAVVADRLACPDGVQDLRSWLCAFVRDILEVDAIGIYRRRDRIGRLHSLELVSGDTLKPLIEEHGRTPLPPAPAYQQFVYGMPGALFTTEELDYLRETPRTDSVYGISRVERIILRVNQGLRKQDFDLARFTDGVAPLGTIALPEGLAWSPEQVDTFQTMFNGLLAGNDQMRVRARALPPGASFTSHLADDPQMAFDRFLLNVTVAAFGLTMDELGFTETSNRSVGQSQEGVVYRRAVAPLAGLVAGYLTRVVRSELDARLTVTFGGFEEPEDFAVRAEALARLVPTGAVSPSDAARILKLPVAREVPSYILTRAGPVLVDDVIAGRFSLANAKSADKVGRPVEDEEDEAVGVDP